MNSLDKLGTVLTSLRTAKITLECVTGDPLAGDDVRELRQYADETDDIIRRVAAVKARLEKS
jgi:hypothetical protein